MTDSSFFYPVTVNDFSFRLRHFPQEVSFQMGSNNTKDAIGRETPIHPVKLSPYYIAEFPVTQALWRAVMGKDPAELYFKGDNRPVERVSWYDIMGNPTEKTVGFLTKLNQLTEGKRPDNYHYNLPTEAQWEYAARADSSYEYSGSDKPKEVAWYHLNSHRETKAVGQKAPNAFGLYDMSGNVWEWCRDWYGREYYQQCFDKGVVKDPTGLENGTRRVFRGGAWDYFPQGCRVACRYDDHPSDRGNGIGFRLVLSL